MTFPEFDEFFDGLILDCKIMRDTKGKEYAGEKDRFDNFNRTATKNDISRLKAANIFMGKHIDSIDSYVKNERTFSTENIRGRFVDLIVYAALMAGMIQEDTLRDEPKKDYSNEIRKHLGSRMVDAFHCSEILCWCNPKYANLPLKGE